MIYPLMFTDRLFIFNLIQFLLKKIVKLNFFLNQNWFKRPVSVWFFRTKTDSNRFGSVFPVWLCFFQFRFDSVRFGFFSFRLIKLNRTGYFFKILIGFFHGSVFLVIFSPYMLIMVIYIYISLHLF